MVRASADSRTQHSWARAPRNRSSIWSSGSGLSTDTTSSEEPSKPQKCLWGQQNQQWDRARWKCISILLQTIHSEAHTYQEWDRIKKKYASTSLHTMRTHTHTHTRTHTHTHTHTCKSWGKIKRKHLNLNIWNLKAPNTWWTTCKWWDRITL